MQAGPPTLFQRVLSSLDVLSDDRLTADDDRSEEQQLDAAASSGQQAWEFDWQPSEAANNDQDNGEPLDDSNSWMGVSFTAEIRSGDLAHWTYNQRIEYWDRRAMFWHRKAEKSRQEAKELRQKAKLLKLEYKLLGLSIASKKSYTAKPAPTRSSAVRRAEREQAHRLVRMAFST